MFICRNPYVRLLSGFIEKHDKGAVGDLRPVYTSKVPSKVRNYVFYHFKKLKSFPDFVEVLYNVYKMMGESLNKSTGANHHFAQQARFCGFD